MKYLILGALFAIGPAIIFAQNKDFTKKADADPEATAILDAMRAKYDAYKTLEVNFEIVIEVPEQPRETQKGQLRQKGERYRLNLDGQTIVSDGTTLWLFSEKRKEVQINDVEEEEGSAMSPKDLMNIYKSDDYVYTLTNEMEENGRVVQQIEFKPLDSDSEYSKIRLTLDRQTKDFVRIKVFSKDGSRYTFILKSIVPNRQYPDDLFQFKKSECPDCHWEDLRI
ncbi:MAG: outer membrane lipoprotein carrier protein LolA [Bacteroidetes bacterium]|nr:MAG: outer membrane lipoprotein carrier protein LolA [Bacteroidota bacterium]